METMRMREALDNTQQFDPHKRHWPVRFLVAMLILLPVLFAIGTGSTQAQGPVISPAPPSDRAGAIIRITGDGFLPGSYPAQILWDGEARHAFFIPEGGHFETTFVVPLDANVGLHKITVCAGSPCFSGASAQEATAEFAVTKVAPYFDSDVAFVFAPDPQGTHKETAAQFAALLAPYGLRLQLIPQNDVLSVDFTQFSLVILGAHTGRDGSWGTPDQVAQIAKNPRVLGLAQGGYAFFGQLKLGIGYPNGFGRSYWQSVAAPNPNLAFYQAPHNFAAMDDGELRLYEKGVESVAIPADNQTAAVLPIASPITFGGGAPTSDATIIAQGCRTLWGMSGAPAQMTPEGRALFGNAVIFALGHACDVTPQDYCASLHSPAALPGAARIRFDDLDDATVIGDYYQNSYGVRFENSQLTRSVTYAVQDSDTNKSSSPPNVAINDAIDQNVPMRIDFDWDQTHVGAWLGSGDSAGIRATLIAYDRSGEPICSRTFSPVPASHTLFAGLYDALGRIARVDVDYGDSGTRESIDDLTFAPFAPANQIQVCHQGPTGCVPAAGATVYQIRDDVHSSFKTGDGGYVQERRRINFGDQLWVMNPISSTDRYTFYNTNDQPVAVTAAAFNRDTPGTLIVPTAPSQPLIVYDLDISAQWYVSADPAFRTLLEENIDKASNYFYDFTDGQMVLGRVTVHQNYDQWSNADVRLYASNSMRPKAVIGGVTAVEVADPVVADLKYYPGHVYMGSTWDQSGTPIRAAGLDQDGSEDWALALAHELGHYWLFLFDTYLGLDENEKYVEIETCTGSAMGWVYEQANTEFVADESHWNEVCANTLANQLLKRTEWATIRTWYADLVAPSVVNPGPDSPYTTLTEVVFQPPSTPATPLANQTFDLAYAESETASPAARAFLIRNNLVMDQGKPISGTTQMALNGAQTGDRFCVFDVSTDGFSRHQYGCESLAEGDNELQMEKDTSWAPFVEVSPVTSRTVVVSVTQAIADVQLQATLYPEDETVATQIALSGEGDLYTGTFYLPIPVTSAYVSVAVDETATESDPRREVMVDYGVGGSGASGPASAWGFVPIHSSDGQAQYVSETDQELAEGEFIAWQSMVGGPGVSSGRNRLGNAYKLVALPPHLAANGEVAIRLPEEAVRQQRRQNQLTQPVLHFWDGTQWLPLTSRQIQGVNGETLVSARSQGVGIYALLADNVDDNHIYLPWLQR